MKQKGIDILENRIKKQEHDAEIKKSLLEEDKKTLRNITRNRNREIINYFDNNPKLIYNKLIDLIESCTTNIVIKELKITHNAIHLSFKGGQYYYYCDMKPETLKFGHGEVASENDGGSIGEEHLILSKMNDILNTIDG